MSQCFANFFIQTMYGLIEYFNCVPWTSEIKYPRFVETSFPNNMQLTYNIEVNP